MRNWKSALIAAATAAVLACATRPVLAAQSQAPIQIPPLAEEHLRAAIDALNGIDQSTLKGDAGRRVAAVRKDFEQMRNLLSRPSAAQNGDWKASYSAVERDLTPLIGGGNSTTTSAGASPATMPGLDAVTEGALELFRSNLELFYAGMMGEPTATTAAASRSGQSGAAPTASAPPATAAAPPSPAPPAAAPAVAPPAESPAQTGQSAPASASQAAAEGPFDANGAGALLDRIDAVVSAALGRESASRSDKSVGTTGTLQGVDRKSSAGKVSVDRSALDEILAEVQQLKVMLRVRR